MRFAKHDLIASSSFRFRPEKIRYPPGADLPDEKQAIAHHEPAVKPVGIRSFQVQQTEAQPDGPRYALNERHGDQTGCRILAAYRSDIVETSKENPVMNPEKKNLKHLESEQNRLYFAVCREILLCLFSSPQSRYGLDYSPITANRKDQDSGWAAPYSSGMCLYVWSWLGWDTGSRSGFDGASAIKTAPMITRTATPISSPRATMLRHAWVPMSAA